MATVTVKVDFSLSDYFENRGFGDGALGAARELGQDWQGSAIDILNEEFKKFDLPLHARVYEILSSNNDVRIEILFNDGQEFFTFETYLKKVEWEDDESELCDHMKSIRSRFQEAYISAFDRFEHEVADAE